MPLSNNLSQALQERIAQRRLTQGPRVKRGTEIFEGTDYPQRWEDLIGQEQMKIELQATITSAQHRGARRLDHILLASGLHGVGKTTTAHLIAYAAEVGLCQVSGPITVDEIRPILLSMRDGDILHWDEFHTAVTGNKARADWLLPFMTDGCLMTSQGSEPMPAVTVVASTTDAGKLPMTILSRFMKKPKFVNYTDAEAAEIVRKLSTRMDIKTTPTERPLIARAANNNPRDMRSILIALRDLAFAPGMVDEKGRLDIRKAFEWAGFTEDGIDTVAQDIMIVLLLAKDHTASLESIQAQLGEPGPLKHHEQLLLQKGYITVTGRGRVLTEDGIDRALELAVARETGA